MWYWWNQFQNNKILQNEARGYIIDLKLKAELDDKFDEPDEDEAYILVENMEIDGDITYKNKEKLIEEILKIKEFVIEQKCLCDNVVLYISHYTTMFCVTRTAYVPLTFRQ